DGIVYNDGAAMVRTRSGKLLAGLTFDEDSRFPQDPPFGFRVDAIGDTTQTLAVFPWETDGPAWDAFIMERTDGSLIVSSETRFDNHTGRTVTVAVSHASNRSFTELNLTQLRGLSKWVFDPNEMTDATGVLHITVNAELSQRNATSGYPLTGLVYDRILPDGTEQLHHIAGPWTDSLDKREYLRSSRAEFASTANNLEIKWDERAVLTSYPTYGEVHHMVADSRDDGLTFGPAHEEP
ncbi:MAG: hypothetical protein ACYDCK_13610, partial [Thermoplasmatota archaeon]